MPARVSKIPGGGSFPDELLAALELVDEQTEEVKRIREKIAELPYDKRTDYVIDSKGLDDEAIAYLLTALRA